MSDTPTGTHIEGPPPGTNGAGGPGDIPDEFKKRTVDTDEDGPPDRHDPVHQ